MLTALFPEFSLVTLEGLTDFRLQVKGWEEPLVSGEVTGATLALNGYYFGDRAVAFRWQEGELLLDHLLFGSGGDGSAEPREDRRRSATGSDRGGR